jgi:hypothetical protein
MGKCSAGKCNTGKWSAGKWSTGKWSYGETYPIPNFITRHFFEGNLGILVFFDFLYILRIFGNSRFSTDCFLSDL